MIVEKGSASKDWEKSEVALILSNEGIASKKSIPTLTKLLVCRFPLLACFSMGSKDRK